MSANIDWDTAVGFVKNIGLIFSVFASGYALFSIFKDKPKIDIDILDVKMEDNKLVLKLSFQNSGKQMTSATGYVLELGNNSYTGLQMLEQKIYPSGNHSISRPSPKYVEAYPLELPQGKACHFNVMFEVQTEKQEKAKLRINLINHKSKVIDFETPCFGR